LITRNPKSLFTSAEQKNILFIEDEYNDTWARDYAPISVIEDGIPTLKNFIFNGWGNKFDANLDNQISESLLKKGVYKNLFNVNFILEGGSIESNGNGTILTTKKCLLNSNRNTKLTTKDIEAVLRKELHAKQILWLKEGEIIGDDTDAHVDTLARFINQETIVFVKCYDQNNPNFESLSKMETELKKFTNLNGEPFKLIPIPLPQIIENGNHLPATYANFLITNKQVLLPTYNCPEDNTVIELFNFLFPNKEIEPVYCGEIIKQNGSLHCLTMQLHFGTIALNLFDHE
jgi:agmatine/peptidylarginine deiminase